MPTFRQAGPEVEALVRRVVEEQCPELNLAGVTVGTLFAYAARDKNGQPAGPAIKKYGCPAPSDLRINSQKDRVEGKPDATLIFDGDQWGEFSAERQYAVVDHELFGLEVAVDKDGQIALDDCFRPKLKTRPADAIVAVFYGVLRRHGEAAVQVDAYRDMAVVVEEILRPRLSPVSAEVEG